MNAQTLLKSILSSEEASHCSGDIDSTVIRVIATMLLIGVYLGNPLVVPQLVAHRKLPSNDARATQEPVIVGIHVEILRKAIVTIDCLRDMQHKDTEAEARRLSKEAASKYFRRSGKHVGYDQPSTPFSAVGIAEIDSRSRCGTAALSLVGAHIEDLLRLIVVSQKHYVEAENSLVILRSLLSKSDQDRPEGQIGLHVSSGHSVLRFALGVLQKQWQRASWNKVSSAVR
jgi:hypothetical protein